jgi:hypothetical protein
MIASALASAGQWIKHLLDILKDEKKGGPQYVVSTIFLEKIIEGKIRTSNPQFFTSLRSVNL